MLAYEIPTIKLMQLTVSDIVTASNDPSDGSNTGGETPGIPALP